MPRLEYFIVAESFSVDRDTNSISIFNVYNERKLEEFPSRLSKFYAIACWIASSEEIQGKVNAQASVIIKQGEHSDDPYRFNFTCDTRVRHLILEISDFEVVRPGIVEIELQLDGSHAATHEIDFQQIASE